MYSIIIAILFLYSLILAVKERMGKGPHSPKCMEHPFRHPVAGDRCGGHAGMAGHDIVVKN
jgi:hypothetical protein